MMLVALVLLANVAVISAVTTTFSGNTNGQPTWNRPVAGNPPVPPLSSGTTAVRFVTFQLRVLATGSYTFITQRTTHPDPYMFLYQNSFSPTNQFQNVLQGDDDSAGAFQSQITRTLTTGTPYIVVVTGFSNGDAGAFDLVFNGPGAVVLNGATASGDPHLSGPHGIKLDVYGEPSAIYSLVSTPAFEINMQLADRGPELRFMTSMAVLYQGKSFIITPWTVKTSSAELIAHFEALGAKVSIDTNDWIITIELCAQHTIEFATRHSGDINFLNLEMRVPGCHDAYGGLLGQTYQCKYAHEKFEWSREREEAFRVATLETPSGSYSATASCATEDEYRGDIVLSGGSQGGGDNRTSP
jgi:hypothetical protein